MKWVYLKKINKTRSEGKTTKRFKCLKLARCEREAGRCVKLVNQKSLHFKSNI